MKLRARRTAAGLLLALVASACAGSAETVESTIENDAVVAPTSVSTTAPAAQAPTPTEPPTTAAEESVPANEPEPTQAPTEEAVPADEPTSPAIEMVAVELPAVDVYDLATGTTANLTAFAKPGPTLVWFWAPH